MTNPLTSKEKRIIRRVKNPNEIEVSSEIPEEIEAKDEEVIEKSQGLHDEIYTASNVFEESINELVTMSKIYANRLVEIEAYNESVDLLEQQKIALDSELRLKKIRLLESKDDLSRIEKQRDEVVKQFKKKQFANKIDFLSKNKINSLIAETDKLNSTITNLNGVNSQLDYDIINVRNMTEDLKTEIELVQSESEKLSESIANDQNNLIAAKGEIVALKKSINDENKDISLKRVELNKLNLEVEILTSEIDKMRKQQAEAIKRHEATFSKEMDAASKKYRDLKAKYDRLAEERVGIVNSVDKKKELLFNKRNLKAGIASLIDKDKEKMAADREALDKKQREIFQKEADIRDLK
jgi:chromosome segregation ATPase